MSAMKGGCQIVCEPSAPNPRIAGPEAANLRYRNPVPDSA